MANNPASEPGYLRRLWHAGREGVSRRIGGRWGGLTLFGPLIFGALAGFLLAGGDSVSVGSVLVAALAGLIGVATWLVIVALWSFVNAPRDVDANVRRERDEALRALEAERAVHRARFDAGIKAFTMRLSEGNAVRSQIDAWPKIPDDPSRGYHERQATKQAEIDRREAEYQHAVADWRAACAETVATYLDARTPALERRFEYSRGSLPGGIPTTVYRLREQAAQVYERMLEFQREYEAQSSSAAISSMVQT